MIEIKPVAEKAKRYAGEAFERFRRSSFAKALPSLILAGAGVYVMWSLFSKTFKKRIPPTQPPKKRPNIEIYPVFPQPGESVPGELFKGYVKVRIVNRDNRSYVGDLYLVISDAKSNKIYITRVVRIPIKKLGETIYTFPNIDWPAGKHVRVKIWLKVGEYTIDYPEYDVYVKWLPFGTLEVV